MKLSSIADALENQLLNPNSDLIGFEARFETTVNHGWELRFNKKSVDFSEKQRLCIHKRI